MSERKHAECPPEETVREHHAHGGRLFDGSHEDLTTPEHLLHGVHGVHGVREKLPLAIGGMARIVADNPKEFALIGGGSYVLSAIMMNAVKPRSPLGAITTGFVSYMLMTQLVRMAADKGFLNFKVRDLDGKLVPLDLIKSTDAPGEV